MFNHKRHELIVEEKDVTTVIKVINEQYWFFSNTLKRVGACGWSDEPTKWYVEFYASAREFRRAMKNLSELGGISVKVGPRGTTDLYFMRN